MQHRATTIGGRHLQGNAVRIFLVVLALAGWLAIPIDPALGASRRPNIVLILTDDQRWDTLSWMPNVHRLIASKGVTFSNAYVVNPLCCPSRTSILTGKYSHSTGVYTNIPPYGGYPAFHQARSTVATWLSGAGYGTALIGKYLNEYKAAALRGSYPPGWNRWVSFAQDNGRYYNYTLTINGNLHRYGSRPTDYSTDVLTKDAVSFIHKAIGPMFLYFATSAPHYPPTPAPQDTRACSGLPRFRPPSYNEASVQDKPGWVRHHPLLTAKRSASIGWFRLQQCRSLVDVDRAVARIVAALRDTGRLSNTMIVFMSDNGYLWGEHRLFGKQAPYEESIRVPMVVRYDPITTEGRIDRHLVLNIDLAPTFAALAGVRAPGVEGRSLLPLLRWPHSRWRHEFLVEHAAADEPIPPYCSVHTDRAVYIRYGTGMEELYDLNRDPWEMSNLARDSSEHSRVLALRGVMDRMCRPRPPGW